MSVQIVIALIDLVVVTVLIVRRLDVRLVLLAGAVPLFAVSGGLKPMLMKLVEEMANPGTVVPICTALGFAYVLRITECDQHLIRLLLRPLQHVRWLLIPGGILAGYRVNTTIVSQSGTAAVLGPILIPCCGPAAYSRPPRERSCCWVRRWAESCSIPAPSRCENSPS